MQPEAQTTTPGFLAVSAGTLEIAIIIQGALEVWSLYLFTFIFADQLKNVVHESHTTVIF